MRGIFTMTIVGWIHRSQATSSGPHGSVEWHLVTEVVGSAADHFPAALWEVHEWSVPVGKLGNVHEHSPTVTADVEAEASLVLPDVAWLRGFRWRRTRTFGSGPNRRQSVFAWFVEIVTLGCLLECWALQETIRCGAELLSSEKAANSVNMSTNAWPMGSAKMKPFQPGKFGSLSSAIFTNLPRLFSWHQTRVVSSRAPDELDPANFHWQIWPVKFCSFFHHPRLFSLSFNARRSVTADASGEVTGSSKYFGWTRLHSKSHFSQTQF